MNIAAAVVGYKKSGKTTFVLQLIQQLKNNGLEVSAAKFSHHSFDRSDTDTSRISQLSRDMAGLTENESFFYWSEKKYLPDLLPLMNGDILVVEGGKSLGWLPRILVLDSPDQADELGRDLALATWGQVSVPGLLHLENIQDAARLVQDKGFILPGLDCGQCGRESCRELAGQILSGGASPEDCQALQSSLEIMINGRSLGMNHFVSSIIRGSIMGMLSGLKGFAPGEIQINIKE
ncbi:MAG: molybdopterin-guanine dinucleotide biosynthesis protein MobB [Desulfonatronovibrionaceae bacterium]